ncbi:hypothetical protein RDWZM_007888 [Blomia tropicalis]|uniref:Uncharacterized protein n=1 Tax=Blomia tropicalis TaxID=40697 RepID=A0A9Q0RKW4_BLOTA|nr:hypothetical protein RDWZM_007888 [Blomia tropicalis]
MYCRRFRIITRLSYIVIFMSIIFLFLWFPHGQKKPTPNHINKIKRKPSNEIEVINNLTVNIESKEVLNKYLVKTNQCTIVRRPLYDSETIKFIKKYKSKEFECNHRSLMDKIRRVNATTVYIPSLLKGCQARLIERYILTDGAKFGTKKTDLREFNDFENADAVQIECSGNLKRVIPLVPFKQPLRWPNIPIVQSEYPNNFRPNVIMIGIDAVSRLNFLRHFPQSSTFMDSKRFQSMLGHHKVGDNTLPNLFAMFLGEQQSTWWKQLPWSKKLDSLPFIFKYFSNANYLTTYIEDYPYCGLFTFHGIEGFILQPTNYYLRPVNLVIRKNGLYNNVCYGDRLEMEHYYDYVLEQLKLFRKRKQNHLTWIHQSTVSHDDLNSCQNADVPLWRLLTNIFSNGYNNDSIIMIYSDHAIRIGDFLQTESGYHETRLPFLYIYVPDRFQIKVTTKNGIELLNSEQVRIKLQENSRMLTSHMDIYATLQHILHGSTPPTRSQYGVSLFDTISNNRTCDEAGIPEQYCLCKQMNPFTDSKATKQLAEMVLVEINRRMKPLSMQCVSYTDVNVVSAMIGMRTKKLKWEQTEKDIIAMIFTTNFDAKFEVNLNTRYDNQKQSINLNETEIIGKIIRIDHYSERSFCIAGNPLESFCVCLESI